MGNERLIDKLLAAVEAVYPFEKLEAGEFAAAKAGPMRFSISAYDAKGLGRVSVIQARGLCGLMKMDSLVIDPFDRDAPLFSYDRILAFGSDVLLSELYDTRLDRSVSMAENGASADALVRLYGDLPDTEAAPAWYDGIKYPQSFLKKVKKKFSPRLDSLALDFENCYLSMTKAAPPCDTEAKKKAASAYTEGLLEQGGPSTDSFMKSMGPVFTRRLFREIVFGTGDPV